MTKRPRQTLQILIRLLLKEQSDQGLHCLLLWQAFCDSKIWAVNSNRKRSIIQNIHCICSIWPVEGIIYICYRVRTGLKSTRIKRAFLKSPWKLNLPWKVLENHSKALKSPWILLFSVGLSTVDRGLNQYKIVVPIFGAAYAAPNKGTTIFLLIFPVLMSPLSQSSNSEEEF